MPEPALLEVQGLAASYGPFLALSDVSLSLRAGEIVALLGSNGAGKSTLIRCIAGLLRPRAGDIRWEGASLAGVPAHLIVERGVAVVPEGRRLFPSMTVEEHLDLGAFAPHARAERARRLDEVHAIFPVLRQRRRTSCARSRAASSRWWPSALVEQNVHAALGLAHRAYILESGRVVGEGTGRQLLDDPHVRRAYLGPLAARS